MGARAIHCHARSKSVTLQKQFGMDFPKNDWRRAFMIEPTQLSDHVNTASFIADAIKATTSEDIEALLARLPITPEHDYAYEDENPERGWRPGHFHWVPVGQERGNAGRIKQANHPVNP